MTGKRITKNQRGFTLMEIIVVIAVFSITVVVAVDLFIEYTKLQKRASAEQTLGSDARFITESVSRQFRLSTIDYGFYADPDGDPFTDDDIVIGQTAVKDASGNSLLAIVDQGGDRLRFRYEEIATVGRITLSTNNGQSWTAITPDSVDVERIDFYLAPVGDPFTLNPRLGESGQPKYLYYEQPRLTLVLQTKSLNEKPPVVANFQTTVTSRLYVR